MIHAIRIRSLLNSHSDRQLKKVVYYNLGDYEDMHSGAKIRQYLEERCAAGDIYLQVSKCPNFSPLHGCQCKDPNTQNEFIQKEA